jgi:GAF domain-containing protein
LENLLLDVPAGAGRHEVVEALVAEAIRLTGSTIAYYAILNDSEDELTMLGWSNSAMAACAMIDKPIVYPVDATGLWGDCVRERQPVITNDYENCTRATRKGYPDGHISVIRHMNVPMWCGDRIVGILGVGNKPEDYTGEDASALQELANVNWPMIRDAAQEA